MGTWGTAIFSDDEAGDVRDHYRDLLADEVPDEAAERATLDAFRREEGELRPAVWLALASTQSRLGRLSDHVKVRALDEIATGRDLLEWEGASAGERGRRLKALQKLGEQLAGPQPARRRVRREWKYRTSLERGDVLSIVLEGGEVRLVRVAAVQHERFSDFVRVELLAYGGTAVPPLARMEELRPALRLAETATGKYRWDVAKNHASEADWEQAGFELVGKTSPRPDDEEATGDGAIAGAGVGEPNSLLDAILEELGDEIGDGAPFTTWEHLPEALAVPDVR